MFVCTLCTVVGLDQASKACVRSQLELGERIAVLPGAMDLLRLENRGMVWGLLAGHPLRLPSMTLFGLLSFVFLLGWLRRLGPDERSSALSLSLIVAGALGNFIDRLLYRSVTDFVELSVPSPFGGWAETTLGSSRWPVFNIADIAITLGLLFLLLSTARGRSQPARPEVLR